MQLVHGLCPCAWVSRHAQHERGVLVELLLKPLIGIVDAQLLEAVLLEAFKAVDVQDAEGQLALPLAFRQGCVDAADQVSKQSSIDCLGQCIPGQPCTATLEQ